ncbi:hypothetical protein PLESTM_000248400 [Pleodorina starrii]|nr:hypothetical protein PLESTM_000248400 [Pleodorina starrii]
MAGITKFFKPTGGGGSVKKAEQAAVGTTAREVFSPVGNTKGAQHAAIRPAPDTDSDVEVMGEEVPASLKRKRKDIGPAGSGHRAATGNCAGVSTSAQQPCQQNAPSSCKDGPPATDLCDAVTADVEMSSDAGPNFAPGFVSSPGEDAGAQLPAVAGSAPASALDQVLSPDLQPTAKRQRIPEDQQPSLPSGDQQIQQQEHAATDAPAASAAVLDEAMPQPQYPSEMSMPPPGAQQQQHLQQDQDDHPTASQPQQSVAGADNAPEAAGCPGAAPTMGGDGAAGGTATGGAGAKSGGAGPATLPPDLDLGATLESLRREQAGLEAALEAEMLLPETDSGIAALAAGSEGGRLTAMPTPAQLCAWLEGRTGPLSALLSQLEPLLPPPPPAGADPTALRTSIVDLAQRKCYSAKEAPLEGAAASEDSTPGRMWVWEVREPRKHLQGGDVKDTAARKLAEAIRKRRKELRERLVAVGCALEALSAHLALTQPVAAAPGGEGGVAAAKGPSAAARRSSESRAAKSWNRLGRLSDLEAVEGAYRTAAEILTAGTGGASASAKKERARKQQEKEKERQEKERERQEKQQEKEREREEKVQKREEEARAKEAKKAQEDEAKRRARETAAANKKGYHSNEELQKSRSIMQSFFKRPMQSKPSAGGPAGQSGGTDGGVAAAAAAGASSAADGGCDGGAASGPAPVSLTSSQPQPQPQPQQLRESLAVVAAPSGGRGCSQPAGATPARERSAPTTLFDFSKLTCRLPDKSVVEALDGAASRLPLPAEELAEELRANHARWRQQRGARRRMIGVPPSWARRPSAPTDLRTLAAQYYGDVAALGLAPEGLRTWRRKLIAFPRKESARPPYYGSFSRTSSSVTGRRPFGRDVSLDYEVASDEEWEEEPEGESLSDSGDEADSQAGGGPGEGGDVDEDDGFIVGDDHLSDDEGAQLSGDPDEPVHMDGALATKGAARSGAAPAAAPTTARFMDPRLQQLEAAIDRVRTNNRTIMLVRPMPAAAAAAAATAAAAADGGGSAADVDMEPAEAASTAVAAGLYCRLRAEPRPGLNTGLDPGLLGALRPVVHFRGGDPGGVPVAALAPPLELDVYSAYAAAAAPANGTAAAAVGCGGLFGDDGAAAAMLVAGGGTPGGCEALAAAGAPPLGALAPAAATAAAPGSARAPGSGARGRPPNPGLNATTLMALAEFMSRSGDQKMEKIVDGFLATLPPTTKPPAKTKLREAIKRLGAWSASTKRWQLHGGSPAAAVEHALAAAAAAAAAAAGAQTGTPLAAMVAAAAAGRGLVSAAGAAATSTPTPGLLLPPGLPAPTPAPHLGPLPSPLPTPSTAPGGRPLLPAPASTPLGGATAMAPGPAAHRPTGHQVVLPQHLMQALARLAPEAPLAAATPPPSGAAAAAASAPTPVSAVAAAAHVALRPQADDQGAGVEAMDCDEPQPQPPQQQVLAASEMGSQTQGALLGGDVCLPQVAAAPEQATAPGEGEGEARRAAAAGAEAVGAEAEAEPLQSLPRPMPPVPPPLSELTQLGTGHPFWAALGCWIGGGGGVAGRSRRHGPSWSDVSAALSVFEAGSLEPRLPWLPVDLLRVLLAVCQHRTPSHLRSGAFKALANVAVALAKGANANAPRRGGGGGDKEKAAAAMAGEGDDAVRCPLFGFPNSRREGSSEGGDASGGALVGPLRPTGQPCRCSPQPVTLQALWTMPGLMEALRRGCCDADPDSETDKAARSAARALGALVGVGISGPPSGTSPVARRQPPQPDQHPADAGHAPGDAAEAAAPTHGSTPRSPPAAAAPPPLAPSALSVDAASFRLRVVSDLGLHSALRDAACSTHGPVSDAPPARHVYQAHMLMALTRLAHDPVAAVRLLRPKVRLAREAAAAAEGRPPPPPVSCEVESKWAAKLVASLVAGGREVAHTGCRKGTVQTVAALLDLPALTCVLGPGASEDGEKGGNGGGPAGGQPEEARPAGPAAGGSTGGGGGGAGWGSLLSGNDPRAQLPAAVLTLLVSELRHVASPGATALSE